MHELSVMIVAMTMSIGGAFSALAILNQLLRQPIELCLVSLVVFVTPM